MAQKKTKDPPFSMDIAGGDVLFLVVFGLLYMILIFVFEYIQNVNSFFFLK